MTSDRAARLSLPEGVPALLVTNLVHVRYLSGFTGTAAWLLVGPDYRWILSDFRYLTQIAGECPGWEVKRREEGYDDLLASLPLPDRVGFEADHLPYRMVERLRKKTKAEWVPTTGVVEALRMVKEPEEVARLSAAGEALADLFGRLLPTLRAGETEAEVARRYRRMLLDVTGDPPPFPPIVASGPRGALPHGVASDRAIEPGDLVTLDLGLVLDGYHADMTRTVAVGGEPAPRAREVHEAVRRALERAAGAVAPGMTGEEAHRIAAEVLEEAGLSEAFGHGLGHGVGLEIHEGPRLAPKSKDRLSAGMVFTIEPGAYLAGWGGVRIEDTGVLTEEGFCPFARFPRELVVVG